MAKILLGVVDYNPGVKDYALEKLYDNLLYYCRPYVDILFVSDRQHPYFTTHIVDQPRSYMSEDILYHARDYIRQYAHENEYDAFIWQGSDCYYDSERDFLRLLVTGMNSEKYYAVGGLTSARTDATFPVARRFKDLSVSTEQVNLSSEELGSGRVVSCYGFPGADALLIKGPLIAESWKQFKNFRPWYELRDENPHSLCIEEFWIMKMGQKYGDVFAVDTGVRTWHAHEDGIARRYWGEERSIKSLSFS